MQKEQEYIHQQAMNNSYSQSLDVLRKLQTPKSSLNNGKGTEKDSQECEYLLSMLDQEFQYNDTQELKAQKDMAVQKLRSIVKTWIKSTALKAGFTQEQSEKVGGDLFVFGSYQLKANCQDSDIDSVCVVPKFINREQHFFVDLLSRLKEDNDVTDLFSIQEAAVPLIRLKYYQISFDMLLAKIDSDYIPTDIDLQSNEILVNMSEKCYKSFNGCRVANYLQRNFIENYPNFVNTLKLVKLWAKNKGIYSNVIGYLSGIGWTILVAKICQLYPNYPVNKLLERFFFIYSQWKWQEMPVLIEEINDDQNNKRLSAEQWKHDYRNKNLMMIITPCFPCMNCSHNVSATTLKIIQNKFRKGYLTIQSIKNKKKQWPDLFKKTNFFKSYRHFIEISISANNKTDYIIWKGHVESKLRKLTKQFEDDYSTKYVALHPFPYPTETVDNSKEFNYCCFYYYGIRCISKDPQDKEKVIDLRQHVDFLIQLIQGVQQQSLPQSISIKIQHILRSELHEQNFQEGKKPNWTKLVAIKNLQENQNANFEEKKNSDKILQQKITKLPEQQQEQQQSPQQEQIQQQQQQQQQTKLEIPLQQIDNKQDVSKENINPNPSNQPPNLQQQPVQQQSDNPSDSHQNQLQSNSTSQVQVNSIPETQSVQQSKSIGEQQVQEQKNSSQPEMKITLQEEEKKNAQEDKQLQENRIETQQVQYQKAEISKKEEQEQAKSENINVSVPSQIKELIEIKLENQNQQEKELVNPISHQIEQAKVQNQDQIVQEACTSQKEKEIAVSESKQVIEQVIGDAIKQSELIKTEQQQKKFGQVDLPQNQQKSNIVVDQQLVKQQDIQQTQENSQN